jgi:1,4-alpha-glucan branching enzyme
MPKRKKDIGVILHKDSASFRVWAPFAKSVYITGSFNNWSKAALAAEGDGHWSEKLKGVEPGQEYKFVIDTVTTERYRNDPRSLQLTTSSGNSVIANNDFDWRSDNFQPQTFNQQVLYEMHIGTFYRPDPAVIGTFSNAREKLDYLAELGVNMIQLMPISSMSMDRGWGYASDYIYAVESLYGGRYEFYEFIKAAHQRGIGVILDVVYNHIGPDQKLDLWQFDGWSQDGKGGIYFYNDWRSSTPWGETRPDYGRLEVRQYILDNVRMWLHDFKLDGLRLDSTIYLRNVQGHNNDPQNDIPEGWTMLQDITSVAKKINPQAILIAEDVGGNDYITKKKDEGGAGFYAQWEVGLPHILRQALDLVNDSDRNLSAVCEMLTRKYNNDAFQRIIYSDSHDSAANGGARLIEEISPGNAHSIFPRRRSLLASTIIMTIPGIPMLLQGQEFLQGGSFNDWESLDWQDTDRFAGTILAHKHLIALRKNSYGNTRGLVSQNISITHLNEESKILAYHRFDQGGPHDDALIIINFANKQQKNYGLNFPRNGKWIVRFNGDWDGYDPDFKNLGPADIQVENNTGAIDIAPYSVLILSQDI